MQSQIKLAEIAIEVELKDVKNIHLNVLPPDGRVRIAAPLRTDLERLRLFSISKLGWIRAQRKRFNEQARETAREYLPRESHYLWGDRYLLRVEEREAAPKVERTPRHITLYIRPGTERTKRERLMADFYRRELKERAAPIIACWERRLGVKMKKLIVRRVKTRWGSCTPKTGTILLNLELAKKPLRCLEYIIVHELTHLIERTHNERFRTIMDRNLPKWRSYREELNRLPLGHESWDR